MESKEFPIKKIEIVGEQDGMPRMELNFVKHFLLEIMEKTQNKKQLIIDLQWKEHYHIT